MEEIKLIYTENDFQRIDKFLSVQLQEFTRTQLQMMIDDKLVLVNNNDVKSNYKLKINDEITVFIKEPELTDIEPQDIPLDIIYEDSDIIVINKPSGMVVHPALGNYKDTLVNALLFHCNDLSGINGKIRAGIVHRIDKDTSGLLVACKNDLSHKNLSEQFMEHKVNKIYYCLVNGVIPHNIGLIDAPIGRDPQSRQQMAVVENGKEARTHFKVLERFEKNTLVEVKLETGRTHQIRVHMKYIGYPLVGDPVYGVRKVVGDNGQFLHAKKLEFYHPRTNEFLSFETELPDDFNELLKNLRNN